MYNISRSSYYVMWSSPAQHGPCKRPRHSEGCTWTVVPRCPVVTRWCTQAAKSPMVLLLSFLSFPTRQFFLIKTYSFWQIPSKYFTVFPEKRLQVIFRLIISATLIVYAQSSSSYSISLPYLSDIDMFMDWLQCDLFFKKHHWMKSKILKYWKI